MIPVPDKFKDYGPDMFADFLIEFMTAGTSDTQAAIATPFFAYYPMVLAHTPWVHTPDTPAAAADDFVVKLESSAHLCNENAGEYPFLGRPAKTMVDECTTAVAALTNGTKVLVDPNGTDYGKEWPHGCFFNRFDGNYRLNLGGTANPILNNGSISFLEIFYNLHFGDGNHALDSARICRRFAAVPAEIRHSIGLIGSVLNADVKSKQSPEQNHKSGLTHRRLLKLTNYAENIRYMDKIVGRLVDALEVHGLRETTVVIYTADNVRHLSSSPLELGHCAMCVAF